MGKLIDVYALRDEVVGNPKLADEEIDLMLDFIDFAPVVDIASFLEKLLKGEFVSKEDAELMFGDTIWDKDAPVEVVRVTEYDDTIYRNEAFSLKCQLKQNRGDQAQWIEHKKMEWRCSNCGEKIKKVCGIDDGHYWERKPNYCSNCGKPMDAH